MIKFPRSSFAVIAAAMMATSSPSMMMSTSVDAFSPLSISKSSRTAPTATSLFYKSPEDSAPSPDVIAAARKQLQQQHEIDGPDPALDAQTIVTHCMESLQSSSTQKSLAVCFDFSSDRCRAAVGGSLENFIDYANNPVFGTMVHCDSFRILNVGPLIPGGQHRGAMQTVLVELTKGMTVNNALKAAQQSLDDKRRPGRLSARKRLAEEEKERRENGDDDTALDSKEDPNTRRFLWTLQQERRPPRQNCWLVHEVLFTKNAYSLTL